MELELNLIAMGENAIANRGNWNRLKKLMNRAEAGEKFVIGFLGGSITQGCLASTDQLCYAYRVFEWWVKKFPKSLFTYVNAGIGATDSQFGCARVDQDLLSYDPDFTIVEFSVNDDANNHYKETYEGVVRKIYFSPKSTAMLILNNVFYNDGRNAQVQHNAIGRYYSIPCVSIKDSVYPYIENQTIQNRQITSDDLHPNDEGHAIVAAMVIEFLEKVYQERKVQEKPVTIENHPLTKNRYEESRRFRNDNCEPDLCGFEKDVTTQENLRDIFKQGWTAAKLGASICFTVEGTELAVQYRKTIHKPAPIAVVIVDGKEEEKKYLDSNFEEDWGDKLQLDTIASGLESGKHTVEIKLVETHVDDAAKFYLVSVIASN